MILIKNWKFLKALVKILEGGLMRILILMHSEKDVYDMLFGMTLNSVTITWI